MKFFLISDNVDTKMGMRFAGIDGVVVHTEQEVTRELTKAMERRCGCYSYDRNSCFSLP